WGVALLAFSLAAPYLLPWYAAWLLPLVAVAAAANPRRAGPFVVVGVIQAGVLALTGIPAEPGAMPGMWRAMVLGVHYGAAPVLLTLFGTPLCLPPLGRSTSEIDLC